MANKKAKKGNRNGNAKATEATQTTAGPRLCLCGCGSVCGKKRVFEQGHGARVRGWFVATKAGKGTLEGKPALVQAAFARWDGSAFVRAAFQV